MMLNVSQRLAKANQEKTREKILYCKCHQVLTEITKVKWTTYQGLQMQEEHADNAVTGFIKHKEVHKSVLIKTRNQGLKTSVSQNYTHNRSCKRAI